jgi:arylsulfatase A-like enzyme
MAMRITGRARPNIVYILADDLGYGDVRCFNPGSKIPTTNLDRLAAQGMRFTDAHAASSVCTPSRYALLTGRYCWRTPLKSSVLWPWDPPLIEANRLTVAGLLREQGYRTGCIGKWHLGWTWPTRDGRPAHEGAEMGAYAYEVRQARAAQIDFSGPLRGGPVDCGFDFYFGIDVPNFPPYTWFENDRLVDAPTALTTDPTFGTPGAMKPGWRLEDMIPELVRRSSAFIEQGNDQPFLLYLALTSPHTPIYPNPQFRGKSGAGICGDFVVEMDWAVGEVLGALDRAGVADNTLVIFASDNGPEDIAEAAGGCYERLRECGHASMGDLRGVKRDTWEGGHRVPCLARWPGVTPAGSVCTNLVLLSDFMATCAELTGRVLAADEAEDSISFLSHLRGEFATPSRTQAVYHSALGRFALRDGDYVFIDHPTGSDLGNEPDWFKQARGYTPHNEPGELFDLRQDPAERVNLHARQPERVKAMAERLSAIKRAESRSPIALGVCTE